MKILQAACFAFLKNVKKGVVMAKYKGKILRAAVVVAALVFTFWWGGNAPGLQGFKIEKNTKVAQETQTKEQLNEKEAVDEKAAAESENQEAKSDKKDGEEKAATNDEKKELNSGFESRPGGTEGGFTAEEKLAAAKALAGGVSSPGVKKGSVAYSEASGMVIDKATGKDKYLTDPVPEGKPIPVEPQNAVITSEKGTCTLSIRCDTSLDNMKWLDPNKVELVPKNGVIYAARKVEFYKGESVFNVLLRECKKNKIHMEFQNTPMYNSAYIEGIHNLYEFDCGELSGWMYKVNGWFPNYGCSRYQLKEGDVIEWVYTCNLGIDVGGYYAVE